MTLDKLLEDNKYSEILQSAVIEIKTARLTIAKQINVNAMSVYWNLGKILVKEGATWLNDYLEELYSFSGINDTHDDQVDASVYAFNQLIKSKGIIVKW